MVLTVVLGYGLFTCVILPRTCKSPVCRWLCSQHCLCVMEACQANQQDQLHYPSSLHPIPRILTTPKVFGVSLHLPLQPQVMHIWTGQNHSCLTRLVGEMKPKEAWNQYLILKWQYMINVMRPGEEPLLQASKPFSLKASQFSFKFIATEIITVGLWSNHNAKCLINHTESL